MLCVYKWIINVRGISTKNFMVLYMQLHMLRLDWKYLWDVITLSREKDWRLHAYSYKFGVQLWSINKFMYVELLWTSFKYWTLFIFFLCVGVWNAWATIYTLGSISAIFLTMDGTGLGLRPDSRSWSRVHHLNKIKDGSPREMITIT